MKLIKEMSQDVSSVITEANGKGGKDYFIEGIFLQSNIKNRNGRVYPREVMEQEVNRYNKEMVETSRALGEMGHPDSPTINYDRASHRIVELKFDGDNVIGKAKILGENFPMANIARGLLDEGIPIGVSSRGTGTVTRKQGIMEVGEDFRLATAADIVSDPSAPDAFVQGIMEDVDWLYDASTNSWRVAEQIKEDVKKMSRTQIIEKRAQLFCDFLSKIS